jgi:hypothetical protein
MEQKYKRVDEIIERKEINNWLIGITDGWKIINYIEVVSHKPEFIRMQILLEKEEAEIKEKKKRLFS